MFGRRDLTVPGSCTCRLDTVRIMLNGMRIGEVGRWVSYALGAEYLYSERLRKLFHVASGVEATVHSSAAGVAVEWGAEQLRARGDGYHHATLVASAVDPVANAVTVPRMDWSGQYPAGGVTREALLARALAVGFQPIPEDHQGLPRAVLGATGRTDYLLKVAYRRLKGPDGSSRVLRDEWVFRVYDAVDTCGARYLRAEVQERIGSRLFQGVFCPTTLTADSLGVVGQVCDTLEEVRPAFEDPGAQVARGLTLLAKHSPRECLPYLSELLGELQDAMKKNFDGAVEELSHRQMRGE